MNLSAIGHLVQQRRKTLGLTQDKLAKLSGLSRATINQLEAGTITDLGFARLMTLLNLLGLQLNAIEQPRPSSSLQLLSQTASVSYMNVLESTALASALVDGHLPVSITPQVATLLDEAPLPLIVGTVEEVALNYKRPAKTLWKHLFQWAHALQSTRTVWL